MDKVCKLLFFPHWVKTLKQRPVIRILGFHIVITVIMVIAFVSTKTECFVSKIYPDQIKPRLWLTTDPLLPVAACVQREILLSVLTLLYILCPEGSDEVTKSSVRMQEIHFQSKQMCGRKVLFQSHAVLFLSNHIAHTQGEKKEAVHSHLSAPPFVCWV